MWHDAFHFDSLVWDGPIAIYLFLLGISAGSTTLSVLLRRQGAGSES
ncbi:NrfD/PsrC family molybdoenzyme membrane anchor subunit, partial [Aeromonas sp. HMWF014]